jgi:hypothetical protein
MHSSFLGFFITVSSVQFTYFTDAGEFPLCKGIYVTLPLPTSELTLLLSPAIFDTLSPHAQHKYH